MTICSGDTPSTNKPVTRLAKAVEVSSPQFLPDTIDGLVRARTHLSKGRIAVAVELMRNTEERLQRYNNVVAKRFLHGSY